LAESSAGDFGDAGDVASWMGQARDKAGGYGIAGERHHDRNIAGVFLGGQRCGIAASDDDINMAGNQLVDESGKAIELALGSPALEDDRSAIDVAVPGKVVHHPGAQNPDVGRADADQPDTIDFA
jgi:hypothetical protein